MVHKLKEQEATVRQRNFLLDMRQDLKRKRRTNLKPSSFRDNKSEGSLQTFQ